MGVRSRTWVRVAALFLVAACSRDAQRLTAPPQPSPRFDAQGQGLEGTDALVCVSSDSPAGNYTFTVSDIDFAEGGNTVAGPNPAVVAPDGCFALVTRLLPADDENPTADPVTKVTFSYTSNDAAGGAGYSGTICANDAGIPASSPCGTSVIANVNYVAGSVATFSFISAAQMIAGLRVSLSDLDLRKATDHKFDDMLRKIQKDIDKEQSSHACKDLDHFIKEVVHDAGKKIDSGDAATLTTKANAIQVALGC